MSGRPQWWEYAAHLANRLGGAPNTLHTFNDGSGMLDPCVLVVGVLGYVAGDERIDESDRAMAQSWLDRLVWPDGQPRADDEVGL